MQRRLAIEIFCCLRTPYSLLSPSLRFASTAGSITLGGATDDPLYADVPRPPKKKSERKQYPTPMRVLVQRANKEKEVRKSQPCRLLEHPPDNGLLVPELVEVARKVYNAHESVLLGLSKLVNMIHVHRCRFCPEVHIGHIGHRIRTCSGPNSGSRCATHVWRKGGVQDVIYFPKCFHLDDRVGKPRVGHDERRSVQQIPAIVELCIQAGVDLEKYPTRRREKPVYSIEGRIVDFELGMKKKEVDGILHFDNLKKKFTEHKEEEKRETSAELATATVNSWIEMISGAELMMKKYSVKTCGYCLEVQVGPKGHKVRMCRASKHQSRNGLHAWQEATMDDLVGPNYVWHVRDLDRPTLANNLKRYYGKAPAIVELCVQAGAPVPDQYRSMMRLDVVPPDRDEADLVA